MIVVLGNIVNIVNIVYGMMSGIGTRVVALLFVLVEGWVV